MRKKHVKFRIIYFFIDPKKELLFCYEFTPFFVFGFWSLLATKLRKYDVIFLQDKMVKTDINEKKITQLK